MASSQPYPRFGDLLKRFRVTAGLSQQELAERARLSVRGLSDIERGVNSVPRRETIFALVEALKLPDSDRLVLEDAARIQRSRRSSSQAGRSQLDAAHRTRALASGSVPLVGRERELRAIADVVAGTGPAALFLAGEPGIGKSRLLREALVRADVVGIPVLWGGCQRRGGQSAYMPLVDAFAAYLTHQPQAHRKAALQGCGWLARLLPELLDEGIAPAPAWELPPDQERRLMFAAVTRFLANVSAPHGALLVLDDLQWASADAIEMLTAVVETIAPDKLRLLAAYRTTEVPPDHALSQLLTNLASSDSFQRMELGPLAPQEAARLAHHLLHGSFERGSLQASGEEAALASLVQRTGGIPLFVVSCSRALAADPTLLQDGVPGNALPWDLVETVRRRVAYLGEAAQDVAGAAAVIGREAPRGLIRTVVDRPEADTVRALDQLCRERLLIEQGDDAYQFGHDLYREIVLDALGTARRALLHRRVAEALEAQLEVSQPELLAFHFVRCGDHSKGMVYLRQAAEHAQAMRAFETAAQYYRELAALLEQSHRIAETAQAYEQHGRMLILVARYAEAFAAFEHSLRTYYALGDMEGVGRVLTHEGWIHSLRGTPDEAMRQVRPRLLAALATPGLPMHAMAVMHGALAQLAFISDRYAEQLDAATHVVQQISREDDEQLYTEAEIHRGTALVLLGKTGEGCAALSAVAPHMAAEGDFKNLCYALTWLSIGEEIRGAFARARGYIEWAIDVSRHAGDIANLSFFLYRHGVNDFYNGDWQRAKSYYEQAREVSGATPTFTAPFIALGLGQLALARGEMEDAERSLSQALSEAEETSNFQVARWIEAVFAERDLRTGAAGAAIQRLTPLLDRYGQEESDVTALLPLLAWAHLECGELPRAHTVLDDAFRRARAHEHRLALLDALRVRALLDAREQREDAATEAAETMLALSRDIGHPYAEAKALCLLGSLAPPSAPKAAALLTQALAIFERMGERAYAKDAGSALARLNEESHP